MATWGYGLLGPVEVRVDGRALPLPGARKAGVEVLDAEVFHQVNDLDLLLDRRVDHGRTLQTVAQRLVVEHAVWAGGQRRQPHQAQCGLGLQDVAEAGGDRRHGGCGRVPGKLTRSARRRARWGLFPEIWRWH